MDQPKKRVSNKSIAYIIGAVSFLIIAGSVSAYFLYLLPQQKADQLALDQRKLDLSEKERQDNLALEKEKHNSALEVEKAKNENEFSVKQAEIDRELEADCQKQITDLRRRYSNIEEGGYDSEAGECMVTNSSDDGTTSRSIAKNLVSIKSSITFDPFNFEKNKNGFYELTGKVSSNCDQIFISVHNDRYSLDESPYELKTIYEPGATSFTYNISNHFRIDNSNAAPGNNLYTAKANCEGGVKTATKVINFTEWDLTGPGYSLVYAPKRFDENVKTVQIQLNFEGAGVAEDGYFGAKTLAAVKDFQKRNGLVVDGIVGPKTWEALQFTGPSY